MASFFIHFITSFLIHSIVALKVKTGRATIWFRGLLGKKKEKENVDNFDISEKKEKKRQNSAKAAKDCGVVDQTRVKNHASDSNRLRSYASESEKERNKNAIIVAAATEAAADAAEAAAVQAAKTVVRLTSQGRGAASASGREKWAAIKIQDQHCQPVTRHRKSIEKFEERNEFHSKSSSASFKTKYTAFDERPKNVEIDTFKMRSRPCWKLSDSVEDTYFRSSILHALRATPARICTPSYMANTQSFRAKLRSQIAKTRSRPCWKLSDSVEDTYFRSSILHALRATPAHICTPSYMANTQSFRAK